jgi:hypothetical protein
MKDLASEVITYRGIQVQAASGEATTINGFTIDRRGFETAICHVEIGNTTGAPTRFGVTFQVQERSGETDWVNVSGVSKEFSGATTAVIHQQKEAIAVDLRSLGRDVRVNATPTFTAGTTPTVEIAAYWVLGGANVMPPT